MPPWGYSPGIIAAFSVVNRIVFSFLSEYYVI